MLVARLLVVVVLKSWLVCFLCFDVFWDVVLEGRGSKNNNGAADFVSRGGILADTHLEHNFFPKWKFLYLEHRA